MVDVVDRREVVLESEDETEVMVTDMVELVLVLRLVVEVVLTLVVLIEEVLILELDVVVLVLSDKVDVVVVGLREARAGRGVRTDRGARAASGVRSVFVGGARGSVRANRVASGGGVRTTGDARRYSWS